MPCNTLRVFTRSICHAALRPQATGTLRRLTGSGRRRLIRRKAFSEPTVSKTAALCPSIRCAKAGQPYPGIFGSHRGWSVPFGGRNKKRLYLRGPILPEVFEKVLLLKGSGRWPQIAAFMGREYGAEWLDFLEGCGEETPFEVIRRMPLPAMHAAFLRDCATFVTQAVGQLTVTGGGGARALLRA